MVIASAFGLHFLLLGLAAFLTIPAAIWILRIYSRDREMLPLERNLEASKEALAERRAEVGVLTSERDALKNHLEADRERQIKAEEAKDWYDLWHPRIDELKARKIDYDSVMIKTEEARNELNGINQTKQDYQAKLEEYTAKVAGLEKQSHSAEQHMQMLQAQWEDVKDIQGEAIDQIRTMWENLGSHVEEVVSSINDLSHSVKHTAENSPGMGEQLLDLVNPRLEPFEEGSAQFENEIDAIQHLENHLKRNGLRYSSRVLRAFHTSLKISDISALTVLAGISGTGKSELPKRYAEALGIHCLTLPVQPRWDSPQDLFGFYNYMENRYKATDLSRALLQMQKGSSRKVWREIFEDHREPEFMQDQLLLVLLDEMNLARVEYYFSEFLSRLEGRDNGSPAKFPIEIGPSKEGGSPELVIENNILFVGTMNADESTMALSDKVLDRANTLQFGKPSSLEPILPDLRINDLAVPALSKGTWQSWIRTDIPQEAYVQQVIADLNVAMDLVGRPFAFRVSKAITSYVANYPMVDQQRCLNNALADQIEQRIIPKLRGLECRNVSEGLNKIEQIISAQDDQPLLTAFKKAQEDDFFSFPGVKRPLES